MDNHRYCIDSTEVVEVGFASFRDYVLEGIDVRASAGMLTIESCRRRHH